MMNQAPSFSPTLTTWSLDNLIENPMLQALNLNNSTIHRQIPMDPYGTIHRFLQNTGKEKRHTHTHTFFSHRIVLGCSRDFVYLFFSPEGMTRKPHEQMFATQTVSADTPPPYSPDTICWTLFRYTWFSIPKGGNCKRSLTLDFLDVIIAFLAARLLLLTW